MPSDAIGPPFKSEPVETDYDRFNGTPHALRTGAAVTLWHYTCHHRAALIGRQGVLKPHRQPFLDGLALVWLTDLDVPDINGLGLTSTTLRCDRTEARYRVLDGDIVAWREWAEANRIDRLVRSELTLGRRPRHWFVSTGPVAVVREDP